MTKFFLLFKPNYFIYLINAATMYVMNSLGSGLKRIKILSQ